MKKKATATKKKATLKKKAIATKKKATLKKKAIALKKKAVALKKKATLKKKAVALKKKATAMKKKAQKAKKAKRTLIRGSRRQVFLGFREKCKNTGHKKESLIKNNRGRIVSKIAHKAGQQAYQRNNLGDWVSAMLQARENLGCKGFVPCKKGEVLYIETMKIYKSDEVSDSSDAEEMEVEEEAELLSSSEQEVVVV